MMTTVLLYGDLRQQFGKRWLLDVANPAEAIRALCSQARGFRKYLIDNSQPGYHVLVDDHAIDSPEHLAIGGARTIKIIPAVQGGKNAIWTIIIGIALVAFSYGLGGVFAPGSLGAMAVSAVGSIGVSLILGGVAQLLFAPPKQANIADDSGTPNYAFTGPVNTSAQGHPVPICYGRLRVGSAVISASFHTSAYADGSGGDQLAITMLNPTTWTSGTIALTASGGTAPYTWAIKDNPGSVFTVAGSTLTVTGSPVGSYQPTLRCTDSTGEFIEEAIEILCGGAGSDVRSQGLNPRMGGK